MTVKTIIMLFFVVFVSIVTLLQECNAQYEKNKFIPQYGLNNKSIGYASVSVGGAIIDKEDALTFGGKCIWLPAHSLGLGIGINMFMDAHHYDFSLQQHLLLKGGYAGIYIEPILFPKLGVHLSFPVMLGVGDIMTQTWDMPTYSYLVDELFFMTQLTTEIEVNINENFRIALGASRNFTTFSNNRQPGATHLSSYPMENWGCMITFKLGKF